MTARKAKTPTKRAKGTKSTKGARDAKGAPKTGRPLKAATGRRTLAAGWTAVRRLGLAMPGVEESSSWGSPALKIHGRMFACIAINKEAEPGSLVIHVRTREERDEMIAADPGVYYVKPHYENYPCVLVRLSKVGSDALRDLLAMSVRVVAAKRPRRKTTPRSGVSGYA